MAEGTCWEPHLHLIRSAKAPSPSADTFWSRGIRVSVYEFGVGRGDPVQSIIFLSEQFKLNRMVRLGNDHTGSSIEVASVTLQ